MDRHGAKTLTRDSTPLEHGQTGVKSARPVRKGHFAAGGLLGALAMSSCCIMPLALFSLGVTGAWIGNLAALYPYKWFFFVPTAGFLAAGFYTVYRKPPASACAPGAYCAAPISDRINKIVLWSATVLVLAALAFPYVAPSLLGA